MGLKNNALYAEVAARVRHQIQVGLEPSVALYPKFATTIDSTTDREDYDWLGAFPAVREWLGDMVFDQLASADFSIKNREFYNGIRLPKQKIDDGKTGYFSQLATGLVEMMNRHPDKLLFELMNAGESTECFDGQNFFDTDHVWGDSGTQSNLLSKTVVDKDAPTKAECISLLQDVLVNMLGFKNDRGEPFVFPTAQSISDLTIVCPLKYWPIMDEAFNGAMKVEGGAALPNYTLVRPDIIPVPSYTGDFFDVYRTGQTVKPFVFQDREPMQVFTKGYDDPTERDIIVGGKARYNLGPFAWWLATRVTLSNAA